MKLTRLEISLARSARELTRLEISLARSARELSRSIVGFSRENDFTTRESPVSLP